MKRKFKTVKKYVAILHTKSFIWNIKKKINHRNWLKKTPDNSIFGTLRLLVVDFLSGKKPS
jgi:hypothetical protein